MSFQGLTTRRQVLKSIGMGSMGVSAAALLAACNNTTTSTSQTKTKGKIAFMSHGLDPFFVPIVVGGKEAADAFGWGWQFVGPQHSDNVSEIVNVLDQVLATKPDVLAMTVTDVSQEPAIERALSQGIVVICFNARDQAILDKYSIPFIGTSTADQGRLNGQLVCKYAKQLTGKTSGEIVVELIVPGAPNVQDRATHSDAAIQAFNAANGTNYTTSRLGTDLNENTALQAIQAKYTKDGSSIVGWCNSDYCDWFIGDFMTQNNIPAGHWANGGTDELPGVMKYMKSGHIQWTLGQNPYAQGFLTTCMGYMAVAHKYPPVSVATGPEVVEKAQVDVVAAREAAWANVHVAQIPGS